MLSSESPISYTRTMCTHTVYLPEVLVKMRLGGASNRLLANITLKSQEDLRALRRFGVGGWGDSSGRIPQRDTADRGRSRGMGRRLPRVATRPPAGQRQGLVILETAIAWAPEASAAL